MFDDNINPTKKRIYLESARLFATNGYHKTSLDEIARNVGIRKPSIFNHFKSKRSILDELYEIYETERRKLLPDLQKLLELVGTEPPLKVLEKTTYHFPPDIEPFTNCIISTAAHMLSTDEKSQKFVADNVLNTPEEHVKPLLYKMIELNRIENFEVEIFCEIVRDYCFASISYIATPVSVNHVEWKEKLCYMFKTHMRPI